MNQKAIHGWGTQRPSPRATEQKSPVQKLDASRNEKLLEAPIALPENKPPKSITFRILFRFCPSACK
jgi:hypothetical protein